MAETDTAETDLAEPVPCTRCSAATTLIHIVGNCADCLADMGLRHPEQFAEFKRQVLARYGSGST